MGFTAGRIIIFVHPTINNEARIKLIPGAFTLSWEVVRSWIIMMDCLSISSSSSDFTFLQSVSPDSISYVGYRLIRIAYFEQCTFQSMNSGGFIFSITLKKITPSFQTQHYFCPLTLVDHHFETPLGPVQTYFVVLVFGWLWIEGISRSKFNTMTLN